MSVSCQNLTFHSMKENLKLLRMLPHFNQGECHLIKELALRWPDDHPSCHLLDHQKIRLARSALDHPGAPFRVGIRNCEERRGRASRGIRRQAAFSVQEEHGVDLVIGDFWIRLGYGIEKLRHSVDILLFSPDGDRPFLVRQHPDNGKFDLLSCTTDSFHCRQLHTSKDAISSPIEIDERRILFISSELRTDGPNLRSKYLGFPVNTIRAARYLAS